MFDGESKQRVVRSVGRKRDLSRNQLLEDSRKQREDRILEKKKIGAVILIQKNIRRFLAQRCAIKDFKACLSQQLITISRITSMIPDFCVPVETVLLLIRYSVHSRTRLDSPDDWLTITSIIVKSLRVSKPSLNISSVLSNPTNLSIFQVSFAAYCREMFLSLTQNVEAIPQCSLDFYCSIFSIIDGNNNPSFVMQDTVVGTLRMLGALPFQTLQAILDKLETVTQSNRVREVSNIIFQICEVLLKFGDHPSEECRNYFSGQPLLGFSSQNCSKDYNQNSWQQFTEFILTRPAFWTQEYLVSFWSANPDLLSQRWNSLLTSTIECDHQMPHESYLILAKNFLSFASQSKELYLFVNSNLWTKLLYKSFENESIILKAVYLYHQQPFLTEMLEESDEITPTSFNTSTRIFEVEIQLCQAHISESSSNILEKNLIICLEIIQHIVSPTFLRAVFDLFTSVIGDNFESYTNLIVIFSKLFSFSPPGSTFGESRSIIEIVTKSFTFESNSYIFVRNIWLIVLHDCMQGRFDSLFDVDAPTLHSFIHNFYFLSVILSNQMLVMDDREFLSETKSLTLDQFDRLLDLLKDLLYQLFWIIPPAVKTESLQRSENTTVHHLLKLQLMFVGSKILNQILTRNERIKHVDKNLTWSINWQSEIRISVCETELFPLENPKIKLILLAIPQVIPFENRVTLFHQLIDLDKEKIRSSQGIQPLRIEINRGRILQSAFDQLHHVPFDLKRDIKVTFINQSGAYETGIDGGGLFKEFMEELMKEICEEHLGFFRQTSENHLVPNSGMNANSPNSLRYFNFLGRMLGKSIYEKILVEPQFAGMFLNHLLGRTNLIDDLMSLDEQVYLNILRLKQDYLNGNNSVEDLGLYFEINQASTEGNLTFELIPNGSEIPVSRKNLMLYIYLYANFKLNVEISKQCRAFLSGFHDLVPLPWIRMFSSRELQLIIGGDGEKPIDLIALQSHCTYSGGYHPSQPYIQEFWRIIESFSPELQRDFLRFVTSCSRPPLQGFSHFNPPFNIMKVPTYAPGETAARLPMASACFNQLKLPIYETIDELRVKLLYSIQSKSGFELT